MHKITLAVLVRIYGNEALSLITPGPTETPGLSSLGTGFLTLQELVQVQRGHELFSTDENDMLERLEKKLESGNVVAIDLRLGSEVFLSCEELPRKLDKYNEYIAIEPGEFALLTTYETLDMPRDILAFISMRFQYKQQGLINISGFHIDPAYKGRIVYSVFNAGPNKIVLKYKDEVFTLIMARIATKTGDRKYSTFQNVDSLKSDTVSRLVGEPLSLRSLESKINKLENWLKVIGYAIPIAVAVAGVIFGLLRPLDLGM